jgi:hypothetical protein
VELVNATRMVAGYTLGLEPDGRERIVVAVKGTFTLPRGGEAPRLADEQLPLVMADEFTGEPGFSATLVESEFPPVKPRCDVLLNGSAYAPGGRPAARVAVGLRLGTLSKAFQVVGDRRWEISLPRARPGDPQPFTRMPISYDRAYGGVDTDPGDPENRRSFEANPVGVGYHPLTPLELLVGKPLPNTEELDRPVTSANGSYRPMSFGPVGRNVAARVAFAGTYDQRWLDDVFPFLPSDFNPLYYQCAPANQQIDYPRGGEWVELYNLTPEGRTAFQLPAVELPVEFTNAAYERSEVAAVIDTILLEPDEARFSMVWRASLSLRRNIFEVKQCVVGRMPRGWYRARELGKDYYRSIGELVGIRAAEAED